jgi:hypothetical protein
LDYGLRLSHPSPKRLNTLEVRREKVVEEPRSADSSGLVVGFTGSAIDRRLSLPLRGPLNHGGVVSVLS